MHLIFTAVVNKITKEWVFFTYSIDIIMSSFKFHQKIIMRMQQIKKTRAWEPIDKIPQNATCKVSKNQSWLLSLRFLS